MTSSCACLHRVDKPTTKIILQPIQKMTIIANNTYHNPHRKNWLHHVGKTKQFPFNLLWLIHYETIYIYIYIVCIHLFIWIRHAVGYLNRGLEKTSSSVSWSSTSSLIDVIAVTTRVIATLMYARNRDSVLCTFCVYIARVMYRKMYKIRTRTTI